MKRFFISIIMMAVLASCAKPYVIVQIADAQLGFTETDAYKAAGKEYEGDVSYEIKYLTKAVEMVNEIRPDAVVFTGDQVHNPGNSYEWSAFKTAVSAISKDIKVLHLPGNHDIHLGENEVNMEPFEERFGKGNFVYDNSDVKIVGINTNYIKYNDPRENEQFECRVSLNRQMGLKLSMLFSLA
jgi:3',5'-cyclic AMP phosphodiesterase CpdA